MYQGLKLWVRRHVLGPKALGAIVFIIAWVLLFLRMYQGLKLWVRKACTGA